MVLGARPIGTRSIGDSAPVDPVSANYIPQELFGEVSFVGQAEFDIQSTIEILASVAFSGTSDLQAAGAVTIAWARLEFKGRGRLNAAPIYNGTRWKVVVVENDGTPVAELENAVVGPVTFGLNQPETWSFNMPVDDTKLSHILDQNLREVQLWRGEQLISWGPIVRPQISDKDVNVSVVGAMWHLGRRHIGKAERTNYVNNGDFEDGLTGWDFRTNEVSIAYGWENAQATPPIHSIANFPVITGSRSLSLENYVAGADAWASQQFLWEVEPSVSPDGDEWTIVGYVYMTEFTAEASEGRGLYLERFSTTQLNPDPLVQAVLPGSPLSLDVASVPIDERTPLNVWTRMEIGFKAPVTGEPEIINVRLYAPDGKVFWDRVSLTLDERTGYYGTDQAIIIKELVEHLQDPVYDKSDVNISTDCPPTGVLRDRVYQHSEHQNGLRAIEEFTTLSDGVDIEMTYTPTKRVLRTHFPQKGSYLPRFALETRRNISSFAWTFDGESAATSVIVLGEGGGSGREESAAINTINFAGLTLEEVFVAPPGTKIESLDNLAVERLASTKYPEIIAVKTTPAIGGQVDPIGILSVGDRIPVNIESGQFAVNDIYRIMRMSINQDDTMDLVLNRRNFEG